MLAFLSAQIHVARATREPVCFAHRRHRHDVDLVIEIAHHPANDGELLEIFLSKHRRVRLQNIEELRDDCTNASEMPRPRFALEHVRQRIFLYERRALVRIHFVERRPGQKIDTRSSAEIVILLFRPWISFVIASRPKLEWVYENADDYFAISPRLLARNSNQLTMRLVQRPHCRHEYTQSFLRVILCLGNCRHNLHRALTLARLQPDRLASKRKSFVTEICPARSSRQLIHFGKGKRAPDRKPSIVSSHWLAKQSRGEKVDADCGNPTAAQIRHQYKFAGQFAAVL